MIKRNIYIWGTGKIARELIYYHYRDLNELGVIGFIDNDRNKWGSTFGEWKVFSPDVLIENTFKADICIANAAYSEISRQIHENYPTFSGCVYNFMHFDKIAMIKRYNECKDYEINEILEFLKSNDLQYFNYDYTKQYVESDIEVSYDYDKKLYFFWWNHNRMYLSKKYNTIEECQRYIKSLLIEQDIKSPHRYLEDNFGVEKGDVVIDAGAAEGMFTLSIIDKASKVYLFEPDKEWCEALRYTLEPFKEKIVIVDKGLSNYTSSGITTLDDFLKGEQIDFLKMDIEGEEYYALLGAEKTMRISQRIKAVICTYHQEFAYEVIYNYFKYREYKIEHSYGYMWFHERNNAFRPYILRRGLIRAEKQNV